MQVIAVQGAVEAGSAQFNTGKDLLPFNSDASSSHPDLAYLPWRQNQRKSIISSPKERVFAPHLLIESHLGTRVRRVRH